MQLKIEQPAANKDPESWRAESAIQLNDVCTITVLNEWWISAH